MFSHPAKIILALSITLGPILIGVGVPFAYVYFHTKCWTRVHERISSLSSFDFEISETICHTLVVDDAISIFASGPGRREKVLLFKYDPGGDVPLPRITSVDPQTVLISVPWISSIQVRRRTWDGMTIEYDIGKIDYPGPERSE
jgi:hypothetical protein